MADPVLNEQAVVAFLRLPAQVQHITTHQTAAVQALVDLYDRGCTRDQFVQMAGPCVALYSLCAKLSVSVAYHEAFNSGELEESHFIATGSKLIEAIDKELGEVKKIMGLLMQCPGDKDVRH